MLWLLPWLLFLIVIGTVAQRYIGLDASLELFFTSYIVWIGIFPTPGGFPTLLFLAVSLIANMLQPKNWKMQKAGILISHLALLLFLLSGYLTYKYSQEGYIAVAEGQSSQRMYDYVDRIVSLKDSSGKSVWSQPFSLLRGERSIQTPAGKIFIQKSFSNTQAIQREKSADKNYGTLAEKIDLLEKKPELLPEDDVASMQVIFKDTTYVAVESLPSQFPKLGDYELTIEKKPTPLPFILTLQSFEKLRYPGSDQAREYRSLISLRDTEKSAPHFHTISMNQPLRYRGVALYQSSYLVINGREASVLAVVINPYWWMPYLAGITLFIGLLWQLLLRMREVRR